MTIKQFIEKAIEGGWRPHVENWESTPHSWLYRHYFLTDPKAWKAVWSLNKGECWACEGKKYFKKFASEELDKESPCGNCDCTGTDEWEKPWIRDMKRMIDALAEGKTIEEFIQTL